MMALLDITSATVWIECWEICLPKPGLGDGSFDSFEMYRTVSLLLPKQPAFSDEDPVWGMGLSKVLMVQVP